MRGPSAKFISQRDVMGCGIACVAMLVGASYATVKRDFAQGMGSNHDLNTEGTTSKDIRRLLATYGLVMGTFRRLPKLRDKQKQVLKGLANRCIVRTRTQADGSWHWLLYSDDLDGLADPELNRDGKRKKSIGRVLTGYYPIEEKAQ